MSDFSDFVVYVDESGDHCLTKIESDFPVFVLSFCLFRKSDDINASFLRFSRSSSNISAMT